MENCKLKKVKWTLNEMRKMWHYNIEKNKIDDVCSYVVRCTTVAEHVCGERVFETLKGPFLF